VSSPVSTATCPPSPIVPAGVPSSTGSWSAGSTATPASSPATAPPSRSATAPTHRRPPTSSSRSPSWRRAGSRSADSAREIAMSEATMSETTRANPLDGVLRALLVTADQCCPAIIGQAHLLYHGRLQVPCDVERTLSELKRDAAGLIQAIAAVEAALQ